MTQHELDFAVSLATGDELHEVQRLGFSLADPVDVDFDPEPWDSPRLIDWDALDLRRQVSVLPQKKLRRFRR